MDEEKQPKLVNRRENRKSTFKMGRTIGEKREKLETANERAAARKKDKKKKATRISLTVLGFLVLAIILIILAVLLIRRNETDEVDTPEVVAENYQPTIEIVDEDAGGQITSRMKAYIGQAEKDFKDLNYTPVKAVIPSEAIREVDFYLEGRPGFIKMIIDRGTAVSVEDADRMIRYLEGLGVSEYEYIDVRIEGKAYWK